MHCEEARLLVRAHIDNEPSDDQELVVSEHIVSCLNCARVAVDYRQIGRNLASGFRYAPATLTGKIRASIKREKPVSLPPRSCGTMRWAAVVVCAMSLSALATGHAVRLSQEQAFLEREILTAHVRSLVQDRPLEIASSDGHTVKPWFNGRIAYAPMVRAPTFAGFPPIEHAWKSSMVTASLLYTSGGLSSTSSCGQKPNQNCRAHVIWPSRVAPLTWSAAGAIYWVVSDLNFREMGDLHRLL